MTVRSIIRVVVCTLALLGMSRLSIADEVSFTAEQLEFFEKEVRPLLVEHCQACHGEQKQKGELRLDSREALLKGGETGPGVVPGRPEESEVIKALQYDPAGYQMPPDGKLPDAVVATFVRWVEMGAPWPPKPPGERDRLAPTGAEEFARRAERWSFQPLKRVVPPEVKHQQWPKNAIDQFLLSKMEEVGLSPAPEADRRTWIRRAYFDTIGLPPSTAAVEAFVADESPEAWDRVVDGLLASPHYGERWGRHWLDLVRYAESRGHEFDYDVPNPWHYRDYVIRALNDDVPYDQFVVEHLAGDLLRPNGESHDAGRLVQNDRGQVSLIRETEGPTAGRREKNFPLRVTPEGANESMLATGYWYLGEWVHSPVDIRKEETDRIDNMLDVYGKAFLGLTIACARCHDHKFDPISQKDYYALAGYIKSTSYAQRPFEALETNRLIQMQLANVAANAERSLEAVTRETAKEALHQINHQLLAAREVLATPIDGGETVVFEDFEGGTYDGWERTGDAFGAAPQSQATIGSYQGNVLAHGNYFVNSHQIRDGGRGDDHVGTMTSREFIIEHDQLAFLIGGGPHAGKTCLNLLVDGNVVLTATGHASNQMREEVWDLRPLRGRTARLQIVDDERGGWGNIGIDRLLLKTASNPTPDHPAVLARIDEIAAKRGLDRQRLLAWVRHAIQAADDPADPFHGWAQFAVGRSTHLPVPIERAVAMPASSQQLPLIAQDGVYYSLPSMEGRPRIWLSDDPERPIAKGEPTPTSYIVDPDFSAVKDREGTMPDGGALAGMGRAGRTLRTASFQITTGKIGAWVRGGCATYVAVDSHTLVLGPLHGSLVRKHDSSPQWRWIEHDLTRYLGHSAHLEIVAEAGTDFACDGVYQIDVAPPARHFATSLELSNLDPEEHLPPAALGWMHSHPALFGLDTEDFRRRVAEISRPLIEERRRLISQIVRTSSVAPAMLDGTGVDESLLVRGNSNKPTAPVPRRFMEVFHGTSPGEADRGSGRLDLARQMVDPDQTPVLPRVIVNRLWHHYFGRGIVATPDDFGHMGQLPTHPELLDWLATELVRQGWSLKRIHRLMLLSAAYRMSSDEPDAEHSQAPGGAAMNSVDPNNLYLHRMNIKRLEGEIVRDSLISLSGRLDDRMFGPSVPIALTPFQEGRGRPSISGPVDGRGRRSLYLAVRRNFADSFLTVFDQPNPHSSVGRRNVSNVPAQALAMLNSPMVLEQSQRLAEENLRQAPGLSADARLDMFYRKIFSRPPTAGEMAAALAFLSDSASDHGVDQKHLLVWADLCHVLCNTKEFIYLR